MPLNKISLTRRLVFSNLFVAVVVLPLFAIALVNTFAAQAELSERQTLQALSYELLAKLELIDGQLSDDITLAASEFSMPDSGLYAIVRSEQKVLWESPSVVIELNEIQWPESRLGEDFFSRFLLNEQPHFNWQFKIAIEQQNVSYPFAINIIKSTQNYEQQLSEFKSLLWPWLLAISIVFIILQCIWVLWFRQPLRDLKNEINAIETGAQESISGQYPPEIDTVNNQLNRLLSNEKLQRERYRNKLSDLAHSLKTPLAVMSTHSDMPKDAVSEINKIDAIINHQLKKAQGTQSTWHKGCEIKPVTESIVSGLNKLYASKDIQFALKISDSARFFGDEEDLYEMLGNLLDNACKACKHEVHITISNKTELTISISDDGKGLNEEQSQLILERGHRADTYDKGQGIGLSVVQDIVSAYRGEIKIVGFGPLGGASFILTFS